MSGLRHAILGLLARQPYTGYQIAQLMKRPVGYFWQARHSQIYPELESMSHDDLVAATVINGPGPRPTKEYRLTTAGRTALLDWLGSPVSPLSAGRDDFELRIWSAWLLPPDQVAAMISERRAMVLERQSEYRAILASFPTRMSHGDPRSGEWMTLQMGLGYEEHRLAWCDRMLLTLAAG
ncbi:MAG: PadR family transcriptional regulator [Propionibacteriales bacterium]|nr:PadR family transcriptional regulator [Propionibacteriales bacterium]